MTAPRNEAEYKVGLFRSLGRWFDVTPEVPVAGILGAPFRFDAILRPHFLDWGPAIALEVKFYDSSRAPQTNDYTAPLKQCVDYSYCRYRDRLIDLVLLHPGILTAAWASSFRPIAQRVLGQFRVGELLERPAWPRGSMGFEIRHSDIPLWRSWQGLTGPGRTFTWMRDYESEGQ